MLSASPRGADDVPPSAVKVTFRVSKSQFLFASFRSGVQRNHPRELLCSCKCTFVFVSGATFRAGQCFSNRRS
jgi:hypothetical protein